LPMILARALKTGSRSPRSITAAAVSASLISSHSVSAPTGARVMALTLTKLPGLVTITTDPEVAAQVALDGAPLGTTPLADKELTPGLHRLAFSAEQWRTFDEWWPEGEIPAHPDVHPAFRDFSTDEWFSVLAAFTASTGRYFCFPRVSLTVAWGDARYLELRVAFERFADERGLQRPEMPDPPPFDDPGEAQVDVSGFGAVIFTTGFRPDYRAWIQRPEAFDSMGFPIQQDGTSAVVPGLHFVGVHFQRKRKSATLVGIGEDAGIVARTVAANLGHTGVP